MFKKACTTNMDKFLADEYSLNDGQLQKARKLQKENGTYLFKQLVNMGFIDDMDVREKLSARYRLPYLSLDDYKFDPRIVRLIPEKVASEHGLIALDNMSDILTVAFAGWPGKKLVDQISGITACRISVIITTVQDIEQNMNRAYHPGRITPDFDTARISGYERSVKTSVYNGPERRRWRRHNRSLKFKYEFKKRRMTAISLNVCFKGILFKSEKDLPLNSHLIGRIELPDEYRDVICITRIVRTERIFHTEEHFVAVRFESIDTEDENRLQDYLGCRREVG